jgi:phage host-nuclease inhibitor protein Gam
MEIKTWEEADRDLVKFAEVEAELVKQAAVNQIVLQELAAKYERTIRADSEKREVLAKALKKFAVSRKIEFKVSPAGDGRSYEHAGSVLGFRQSPGRVEIRNEDKTIEWLRDFREGEFTRIKYEADREALLAALRPQADQNQRLVEILAAHGIRFDQKDKFFLEVATTK